MDKWIVKLEVEVTARNVKEAREKALGLFWNVDSIDKLRELTFIRKVNRHVRRRIG